MSEPRFFAAAEPFDLAALAAVTGAEAIAGREPQVVVGGIAALDRAGPTDLAVVRDASDLEVLGGTKAGVCILLPEQVGHAPAGVALLVSADPVSAFATATLALFPAAGRPQPLFEAAGVSPAAIVHPTARLEPDVRIDPGVVVGPGAEIGSGSLVGANAVVGPEVRIGRLCSIGPGASLTHALLGDRVVLHAGVRIGCEDSLSFVAGRWRPTHMPQVGRVIIQDDVEVGAGTTIHRGSVGETIVGEGSRIDNLACIGQNASVGRLCVVAAHAVVTRGARLPDGAFLAAGTRIEGRLGGA